MKLFWHDYSSNSDISLSEKGDKYGWPPGPIKGLKQLGNLNINP